jgi:hypothetical protein
VQAKAGEFIIGEVGKINVNSGQTLEVFGCVFLTKGRYLFKAIFRKKVFLSIQTNFI